MDDLGFQHGERCGQVGSVAQARELLHPWQQVADHQQLRGQGTALGEERHHGGARHSDRVWPAEHQRADPGQIQVDGLAVAFPDRHPPRVLAGQVRQRRHRQVFFAYIGGRFRAAAIHRLVVFGCVAARALAASCSATPAVSGW